MQTALKWGALGTVGLATASASAWGVVAYQLSILEVLKVASFLGTVVLACFERGKVFTVFAVAGWVLRVAHTAHMAFLWEEMPTKWHALLTGGKGHLVLLLTTVYDQVIVLSTLPRWLADVCCMLHAAIFGYLVHRYLDVDMGWWYHATMCVALPQACVLAAIIWAARRKQVKVSAKQASRLPDSKEAQKEADALSGEGSSQGAGVSMPACRSHEAEVQPNSNSQPSKVSATNGSNASRTWRLLRPRLGSTSVGTAAGTDRSIVQALKVSPYTRRLAAAHQVCVKMDCDVWYNQVSYQEVAANMQKVLHSMPGSKLHLTAVAVRPGCIMITMNVQPGYGTHATLSSPASEEGCNALAQALLPQLLQVVHAADEGDTADSHTATEVVRKVQIQVDDYLGTAKPPTHNSRWQLKPLHDHMGEREAGLEVMTGEPRSSSPWLGVVQLVGAAQPVAAGAGYSQALKVQVWGLSKLHVVTGWTAPDAGQHAWSVDSSTDLRILARFPWGGYGHTHVTRLQREPGSLYATAEVTVELPWHLLLQHHAGATRNSLLVLTLELCSSQEVLLSSTPLVATLNDHKVVQTTTITTTSSTLSSPCLSTWWWGVRDATAVAAAADVQGCSAALAEADTDMADSIPAWLAFVSDLQLWLLEVQRMAVSSGVCTCSSQAVHAATTGPMSQPCLDDLSRQQLWEGLVQYSAELGLKGVHSMLQQQMQHVMTVAKRKLHKGPSASRSFPASVAGLQVLVQQAICGHQCSQCEGYYKQQLTRVLAPAYRAGGIAITACASTLIISAAHAGDMRHFVLALPWFLMHLAAVLTPYLSLGDQTQSCTQSAWWTLYAYMWRIAVRVLMWAGSASAVQLQRLYSKPGAWLFCNTFMAVYEQVHASMVLPAARLTLVTVLVDWPCTLLLGLRESPSALIYLYAPIAAVGARLLIDVWMRKVLAPCATGTQPSDQPAASRQAGTSLTRTHSKWA